MATQRRVPGAPVIHERNLDNVKLLVWHVDGLQDMIECQKTHHNRHLGEFLDDVGADIVAIQGVKVRRHEVTEDMAEITGWDSYFDLPLDRTGYSGVAVYMRHRFNTPMRVEEGVLGLQCAPDKQQSYRLLPPDEAIGGYLTDSALSMLHRDPREIDCEGRCVIVEFPGFVLFNVLAPHPDDDSRGDAKAGADYRVDFIVVLKMRVQRLLSMGKNVVVAGHFREIEYEHPDLRHVECISNINHLGPASLLYCSKDIRTWFTRVEDKPELMIAYRCPVIATLETHVEHKGPMENLTDLLNIPGLFEGGVRRRLFDAESDLLAQSGTILPQFDQNTTPESLAAEDARVKRVINEAMAPILARRATMNRPVPHQVDAVYGGGGQGSSLDDFKYALHEQVVGGQGSSQGDFKYPLHEQVGGQGSSQGDFKYPLHEQVGGQGSSQGDFKYPLHEQVGGQGSSQGDFKYPLHEQVGGQGSFQEDFKYPLHEQVGGQGSSQGDFKYPLHEQVGGQGSSQEDFKYPLHEQVGGQGSFQEDFKYPLHEQVGGQGSSQGDFKYPLHEQVGGQGSSQEDFKYPLNGDGDGRDGNGHTDLLDDGREGDSRPFVFGREGNSRPFVFNRDGNSHNSNGDGRDGNGRDSISDVLDQVLYDQILDGQILEVRNGIANPINGNGNSHNSNGDGRNNNDPSGFNIRNIIGEVLEEMRADRVPGPLLVTLGYVGQDPESAPPTEYWFHE
ncbi:Class II abasic (AP) endonuclease [Kalmusia sp. IMI 367209]|nr:Class II abasic (AP) endonuclease [Kalmusia sp. IMI 367209]